MGSWIYSSDNVSILLGNGNGTFAAALNYGVGTNPVSVAIGDFNGDGRPDLAVANSGSNTVSILLGNGDGTFAAAVHYSVGTTPLSVAIGDFNRDGKADIAVANVGSNTVSILLGNGSGILAAAVDYGVGASPGSIAIGDFNGDGKADLAVANQSSNDVSILLGNGNGAFATAVNYAAGSYPRSVAIADFNVDGKADLAITNYSSNIVSILLGGGDGTFAAPLNYGVGSGPLSVAVGDLNNDGKPDLAVANNADNNVSILLNVGACWTGCGVFASPASFGAGSNPQSVAVGDFNGDGKADLAVANFDSNNVSILLGNGDGTLAAAVNYGVGTHPQSVAIGDFNGDGTPDLAVANSGSNNVSILLGNGDGTYQMASNFAAGTTPLFVVVGDFNNDGKADLAVASNGSHSVLILLGDGGGSFGAPIASSLLGARYLAIGDFNRDGKLDLAATDNNTGVAVWILLGNGDGTFATAVNYSSGGGTTQGVAVGDFDHDGILDVAVESYDHIAVLIGNGDGTFRNEVPYAISPSSSLAVGDLNGDGNRDLVAAQSDFNSVSIRLGRGIRPISQDDGAFAPAVGYSAGTDSSAVALGDFNGDGKLDLAVTNGTPNQVSILIQTCPPDLTITKSHIGNFIQGDTGKNFTIIVSNTGGTPTSGAVTVTDAFPPGFTATAISGTGWTCDFGTLTCTRSNTLPVSTSYPAITLTFNVNSNATNVTNSATVSGGGEVRTNNDTAYDTTLVYPGVLIAPTNLVANAVSASQVSVMWDAVSTNKYQVFRSSNNGPYVLVGTPTASSFTDTGLTPNTTYLYQVKAVSDPNNVGPPSNIDLATTTIFLDDPIVAGSTLIRAIHLLQLRTAVNAVRAAAGMSNATFTNTIAPGVIISAIDVTELRSNLDAARSIIGVPALQYTDPTLTAGSTLVKAVHVQKLRSGVK